MKQKTSSDKFRAIVNTLLLSCAVFLTSIVLCNEELPAWIRASAVVLCVAVVAVNILCIVSSQKAIETLSMVILAQNEKLEQLNREKKS